MTGVATRSQTGIDRRAMVKLAGGVLCSCCTGMLVAPPAQAKDRVFCAIADLASDPSNYGTPLQSNPDVAVREYLGREAVLMQVYFKLSDSKIFVKQTETAAYATVPEGVDPKSQGRIVLGGPLIESRKNQPYGMLRLAAILAHETAHLFQMATRTDAVLLDACGYPLKMLELNADYLAGTYMAWRGQSLQGAPDDLAVLFFGLGDRDLASQQHHGTEAERFLAFTEGYRDGQGLVKQEQLDVDHAGSLGLQYARRTCT